MIIEEHKDDEEEFESMHEGNKSHKEEEKDLETKSKKSVNKNTNTNDKNDSIQIPKQSSSNVANNQQSNENAHIINFLIIQIIIKIKNYDEASSSN